MFISISYLIIPAITATISLIGRYFAQGNMQWYANLKLPSFTPKNRIFSVAWLAIYITSTTAALYLWNVFAHGTTILLIMLLFGAIALTNLSWSYLFFKRHELGISVLVTLVYLILLLALMYLLYTVSLLATLLMLPHLLWIIFALILNISVWFLNR